MNPPTEPMEIMDHMHRDASFRASDPTSGRGEGGRKKLLIWHWGRHGGGPNYTIEMTRALVERGEFDVHLSYSRQCDLAQDFSAIPVPFHSVDTYGGLSSALTSLLRIGRIRKDFQAYLQDNEIHMVLCTMTHLWNPLVVPILRKMGVPYVLTVHDALLHPGEFNRPHQWWLDREIRQADGIVTLTKHVHDLVRLRHGVADNRIVIAPHGPLMGHRAKREHISTRPPYRLVFFGRIKEYKGLDIMLDAFAILRSEIPWLELRILGHGKLAPYRKKLEALDGVEVDNRYIPEPEVPQLLQTADILVLPYREASQSGVVALAQTMGIPVVVTPVGGLGEQVVNGETGIVAEAVSAASVANATRRLLSDPALYQRCAEGIRTRNQRTWSQSAAIVSQLLGSIGTSRDARRARAVAGPQRTHETPGN